MEEMTLTKTDNYSPPSDIRRFTIALFDPRSKGSKTEAERMTQVDRRKFYSLYKRSEKFRVWFNSEVQMFSETLAAKAMCALSEMMESKEDPYARIQAIRTWAEMMGRIRVNNIHVDNSKTLNVTFLDLVKRARLGGEVENPDS